MFHHYSVYAVMGNLFQGFIFSKVCFSVAGNLKFLRKLTFNIYFTKRLSVLLYNTFFIFWWWVWENWDWKKCVTKITSVCTRVAIMSVLFEVNLFDYNYRSSWKNRVQFGNNVSQAIPNQGVSISCSIVTRWWKNFTLKNNVLKLTTHVPKSLFSKTF